jgi:hypothetical protein
MVLVTLRGEFSTCNASRYRFVVTGYSSFNRCIYKVTPDVEAVISIARCQKTNTIFQNVMIGEPACCTA